MKLMIIRINTYLLRNFFLGTIVGFLVIGTSDSIAQSTTYHCKWEGKMYFENAVIQINNSEYKCKCQTTRIHPKDNCLSYAWELVKSGPYSSTFPSLPNLGPIKDAIVVFSDAKYSGRYTIVKAGYYLEGLRSDNFFTSTFNFSNDVLNDDISSVYVPPGMACELFTDGGLSGNKLFLMQSVSHLSKEFNDQISSVRAGKIGFVTNTLQNATSVLNFDYSQSIGVENGNYKLSSKRFKQTILDTTSFVCERSNPTLRAKVAHACENGDIKGCTIISECYQYCAVKSNGNNKLIYLNASDAMKNLRLLWMDHKENLTKGDLKEATLIQERIKHSVEQNKLIFDVNKL